MKTRVFCILLVLILLSTCMFAFVVHATEESSPPTESTQPSTEATTEPETQPTPAPGGSCGTGVTWSFDEASGILTISGSGAMDDFSSAPWSEYGHSVKTIVIQSGVTTIGAEAFSCCPYATSVSIPSTVWKIGDRAFSCCFYLTRIDLPSSVTHLGNYAFYYCNSLKSINLLESISSCGEGAFSTCQSLTAVTIPSSWTYLPTCIFESCGLTQITIPANIQSIGAMAFRSCASLSVVRFDGSAPNIQSNAFYSVKASVSYPGSNSTWTAAKQQDYGGDLTWLPEGGSGAQASGTFGQSNIMNWKLDGSTLYITGNGYMDGWSASENPPWYDYRGHIKKVVMSGNMQNVYSSAFADCTQLTDIVWPSGITTIFSNAFAGCKSLTHITLPSSVSLISSSAFRGCTGLTSVTLPQNLREIANSAFWQCSSLQSITIPSGVKYIYASAFSDCTSLRTIYFSGNMPAFSEKKPYYNGTFSGLQNVTVYYPANNSSWTAQKVQALAAQYPSSNITFVPTASTAPSQPNPGATSDSTVSTKPSGTPSGTTDAAGSAGNTENSVQSGTGTSTEPPTVPTNAISESTSQTGKSPEMPSQALSPKQGKNSTGWIIATVSVVVVAAGTVGFILLKKRKRHP